MYTDPRSANQMKQVLQGQLIYIVTCHLTSAWCLTLSSLPPMPSHFLPSDALAHQARVRIAQQHAVQQQQPPPSHPQPSHSHQPPSSRSHQPLPALPHSSHHTPPTPHRQQPGFSYFQPVAQAQPVCLARMKVIQSAGVISLLPWQAFHRQPSGEPPSSPQQQRPQQHHPHSTSHPHSGYQGRAAVLIPCSLCPSLSPSLLPSVSTTHCVQARQVVV